MFLSSYLKNVIHQRGFSLVEAAIVLGVVGLVIGGIWAAAATMRFNQKMNQEVQGIAFFISQTRSLYKGLGANGVVPRKLFENSYPDGWQAYAGTTDHFLSPLGYRVGLSTYGSGMMTGIGFQNVPSSYCDQLLPRMYSFADFTQFHNQTAGFIDNTPTNRGIGNYCPNASTTFSLNFKL